jgi:alkylhydroperoxidase/carboxymuconolactone decarboxylase family protein YurZ
MKDSDMKEVSDSLAISSGNDEDRRAVAIEVYKKMMGSKGVLGGDGLDAFIAEADSDGLRAPLMKLVLDFGMGEMWSRPGLDFREKSLITLSLDIATRQFDELKVHVKVALRNGLTVEQIRDLFIHSILYVGFPAVVQSHRVLAEVIEEEGLEKEKSDPRP